MKTVFRKITIALAAAVLIAVCFVFNVPKNMTAVAVTESGTYGSGGTWSLEGGVLTISGSGFMPHYDKDSPAPWHNYCANITNVIIEDGVNGIGDYAFYECTALERITIPDTVKSMGNNVFEGCSSLASVTLPTNDSLTYIGSNAFNGCTNLKEINIPSSVTNIYLGTFKNTGLKKINIPSSVTSIETSAFEGCSSLETVTFDDGSNLETIGSYAFYNCSLSQGITIPDSVTSIADSAFQLTGLKSITIPGSVKSIGESAFYLCRDLASVTFSETAQITAIKSSTFNGCGNLTEINIPSSVTSIGDWAFQNCTGLTDITIPNSVESIGMGAFYKCAELKTAEFNSKAAPATFGSSAFQSCNKLTEIIIPCSWGVFSESNTGWDNYDNWASYADNITRKDHKTGSIGTAWEIGENTHWNICSNCNDKANEAEHKWDEGKITTEPSTPETVTKTYTCEVCQGTKNEELPVVQSHKVCINAEKCPDCAHSDITWTAWTSDNSLPISGKYYLTKDVTVSDVTVIGENTELFLCLNGFTVTMESSAAGKSIYQVEGTLNLSDCKTTGKLTGVSYDETTKPKDYAPVYLGDVGKFNMYGGNITGNSAEGAGGVYVGRNSVFNMYGGTISGNTAKSDIDYQQYLGYGGGVYIYSGTFTMYGGKISGNTANMGGGVNNQSGKFIMKGGEISGNNAPSGAGVRNVGEFTMEDGSILNNTASGWGGGVYNDRAYSVSFTMIDGIISGNTAKNGGGLYNKFSADGDGIRFTMSGGAITGNSATTSGGGVHNLGEIILSGEISINSNTLTGSSTANNVYLDNSVITIGSDFNAASTVGVTTVTAPTSCADPVAISGTTADDISDGFTSDNAACHIIYDESVLKLSGSHTDITKVDRVEPTETETGIVEHWHCSGCGKNFSDEAGTTEIDDITIPALGHDLERVDRVEPTETETGIVEHWHCSGCGKNFSDEDGTTEIDDITIPALGHDLERVDRVEPTETEAGIVEHWHCSGCGKNFSDEGGTTEIDDIMIPALGHDLERVDRVEPTETEAGIVEHWHCSGCGKNFSDEGGTTEIDDITIPALGHDLERVDRVEPTETEAGIVEHWHCSGCGKNFSDEGGTTEIDDIIIPATGSTSSSDDTSDSEDSEPEDSDSESSDSEDSEPDESGNKSMEVVVSENVPNTEITMSLNELIGAVIPEEELAQIKDSDNVKIVLNIEDAGETVPAEDKQAVIESLEQMDNFKLAQYLDVTLLKIVNNSESKITSTSKPIMLTFEIPEAFRGSEREFAVLRVHENETTALYDLDEDENTVTIETDKFSTYVLAYADTSAGDTSTDESSSVSSDDETASSSDENSSNDESSANSNESAPGKDESTENPATGIVVSFIPLAAALTILTVTVKRKKK